MNAEFERQVTFNQWMSLGFTMSFIGRGWLESLKFILEHNLRWWNGHLTNERLMQGRAKSVLKDPGLGVGEVLCRSLGVWGQ